MSNTEKRYTYDEMLKHPSLKRVEGRYERTKWPGVFRYVGRHGVKYGIDYYVGSKQKREMVGSLQEAKRKIEEIHASIRKGDYIIDRKRYTFNDFLKRFKEIKEGSGSSYYESTQKYYLPIFSDFFGAMKLYQISPYDIERFKKVRMETPKRYGGTRSTTTVNRELACLQGLFSKAVTWGMMERNVFSKFKESVFFPEDKGRIRYLTEDEIRRLLDVSPPYLRDIIKGALLTGLRKGDLLGLRWGDIDLEKGILFFNEEKKGGRRQAKTLNDDMLALLQGIPAKPDGYVFHGPDGKHLRDCPRSFRSALRRAGISDFRFHDLRHCSASYLAMRGVSLQVIQQHLGHSNISMTMKYSHISDAAMKEGINKLTGLFTEPMA
jgi:integrase